jgi:hypothetical protein
MSREVKRVPLDWDWPMGETWAGYLNPFWSFRAECEACGGTGYAPEARRFGDEWYGNAPFDPVAYGAEPLTLDHPAVRAFAGRNVDAAPDFYGVSRLGRDVSLVKEMHRLFVHWIGQWSHHLIQADVDALIDRGRLMDFTHVPRTEEQREVVRRKVADGGNSWLPEPNGYRPTAAEVNAWSLSGMGHDSINQWVCVKARCAREGVPVTCPECDGDGDRWPSQAHKALAESWVDIPPPEGKGWQMWQTTGEGSPMSPVFAMPEELARWLADTGASAFGSETATFDQWLGMIAGPGWAMSAVRDGEGLRSGVAAVSEDHSHDD